MKEKVQRFLFEVNFEIWVWSIKYGSFLCEFEDKQNSMKIFSCGFLKKIEYMILL